MRVPIRPSGWWGLPAVAFLLAFAALLVAGTPAALAKKGGGKPGGGSGTPAIACVKNEYATSGRLVNKSMLVVMDADGAYETVLLQDVFQDVTRGRRFFDAVWSPDASRIALAVDDYDDAGGGGLHTVNADGSGLVRIGAGRDPAWAPMGGQLAFVRSGDIWLVDADGTGETNLTQTPYVEEAAPTWSPDGTVLAYLADGALAVSDLLTGLTADLTSGGPLATHALGRPAWAKTTGRIALAAREQIGVDPWGSPEYGEADIWVLDLGAPLGPTNLTATTGVSEVDPSWSPDDTQVVFRTFPAGDLYALDADGTGLTLVAAHEVGRRSVSRYEAPDWRR